MDASEKQVRIAARLYEARDAMRSILGDGYKAEMTRYGAAVSVCADLKKCGLIEAATAMAQAAINEHNPTAAIAILAAAVELTEPTP